MCSPRGHRKTPIPACHSIQGAGRQELVFTVTDLMCRSGAWIPQHLRGEASTSKPKVGVCARVQACMCAHVCISSYRRNTACWAKQTTLLPFSNRLVRARLPLKKCVRRTDLKPVGSYVVFASYVIFFFSENQMADIQSVELS